MNLAAAIRPFSLHRSRYLLVWSLCVSALLAFLASRTVLAVISPEAAELSLPALLRIYGVGALYDIAFFLYALIPVSLYLLLLPNRLWRSRPNRLLVHLACFASLYGLLFIGVAEVLFWLEFKVRFNFISVDYLVYSREVSDNIAQSYPVEIIFPALFVAAALLYWKLAPFVRRALDHEDSLRRRALITGLLWLLPLGVYAGLDQRLMHTSANNYQNELSGNGPYQFFAAFRNNELDYYRFYRTIDDRQAATTLRREVAQPNQSFVDDGLFAINRTVQTQTGAEQRLNIVLVMVESLSADFLGVFGNPGGLTPNLDRLAEQSLFFTRFYATGTRTTRGLEAVTLSIPPTPGRSIVKRLGHESGMWSLGNVLRQKGYETRFLYGGRGYFDNMNAFFAGNGYDVIDQSSVPEEEIGFENAWGMADEYLYGQALKTADAIHRQGKPFFFHLMTTSNHRPYTFPEGRIDMLPGREHGGRNGAVKYTDWAIGDFLQQARGREWFDDTLFVFVADHTADSAGKTTLPVKRYHIPLFIYSPAHLPPRRIDTLASQIDLAPTLLGLLNMNYQSMAFGKDIFTMTAAEQRALIGTYQSLGLYTPGLLSVISPKGEIEQQLDPERDDPLLRAATVDDPHLRRAIAYYQGASYIYRHGLNAWPAAPARP